MDAGKIMWVMYEHPRLTSWTWQCDFMDIRKRVYTFPKMGEKAYFIAVPTSQVQAPRLLLSPVITDEKTALSIRLPTTAYAQYGNR